MSSTRPTFSFLSSCPPLSLVWPRKAECRSDFRSLFTPHIALNCISVVTLASCSKSLLPRDFEASKFESTARPFDTHQFLNMCQAIFQQPLSQLQLPDWIRRRNSAVPTLSTGYAVTI